MAGATVSRQYAVFSRESDFLTRCPDGRQRAYRDIQPLRDRVFH
nr:MAG TPA: hypothetical protein [Caudoviricetes sp.]